MPEFTKEVRERLDEFVGRSYTPSNCTQERNDVYACLAHIDALEARLSNLCNDHNEQLRGRLAAEASVAVLAAEKDTARAEGHRAGMLRAAEIADGFAFCGAIAADIRAAANEERSEASTAGEGKSHA